MALLPVRAKRSRADDTWWAEAEREVRADGLAHTLKKRDVTG